MSAALAISAEDGWWWAWCGSRGDWWWLWWSSWWKSEPSVVAELAAPDELVPGEAVVLGEGGAGCGVLGTISRAAAAAACI